MNEIDIDLHRLLGKQELTMGCLVRNSHGALFTITESRPHSLLAIPLGGTTPCICRRDPETGKFDIEMLGHEPSVGDFQKWMMRNTECRPQFEQSTYDIKFYVIGPVRPTRYDIAFNPEKSLMKQDISVRTLVRDIVKTTVST